MALNQNRSSWLEASTLQNILRIAEMDESIEVSCVTARSATNVGDNYACDVFRVFFELSRSKNGKKVHEKWSMIAKVVPEIASREKLITEGGHFVTESLMMTVTLPSMHKCLEKLKMPPLAARCFYTRSKKPSFLLMEDLSPRGFLMADRRSGLDLDHCLIALRSLGRFHASSIAMEEQNPTAVTMYRKGMFYRNHPAWITAFFEFGTKALGAEVAKWQEMEPCISEKLIKLSKIAFARASEKVNCKDNDFNVLNHGDFWTNNMLFRYDNRQKPIDHLFVDFQLCVYGSPAIDLLYFLATSPSEEVRFNYRELVVREYHDSLIKTMAQLKCTRRPLSFEELQDALKERAFFEAVVAFTILPFSLIDKSKAKPLNDLMEPTGDYENPAYQEKRYRNVIRRILPVYHSMGLLDV